MRMFSLSVCFLFLYLLVTHPLCVVLFLHLFLFDVNSVLREELTGTERMDGGVLAAA